MNSSQNGKTNQIVKKATTELADANKQIQVLFELSPTEIEALSKVQAPPMVEKAAVVAEIGMTKNGAVMKGGVTFGSIKKYGITPLYYFIKLMLWPISGLLFNLFELAYLTIAAKNVEVTAPRLMRFIPSPISWLGEEFTLKFGIPARKVLAGLNILFFALLTLVQYRFFTTGELSLTGGGNGNNSNLTVQGFKNTTMEVQNKFEELPVEEQGNLLLRILYEIQQSIPEDQEITPESIYAVLLQKLDDWYARETANSGGRRRKAKASRKNKTRKYRK